MNDMELPEHVRTLVIGAGIHGLSTAYHLAEKLKRRGRNREADILLLDKRDVAAGASGIACGVIRNNYFQPAMRELMAHSVERWAEDPEAYHYYPVGYLQISAEPMRQDVAGIAEEQKRIGYPSRFVDGARESSRYMKGLLHDFRAQGITSVLHEFKGGYASNRAAMHGLADKARAAGARIVTGVTVTGFAVEGGAVTAVETDRGSVAVDQVVVAVGPWINAFWNLLGLPRAIPVRDASGHVEPDVRMWHYECLQEGTLGVDPSVQKTNDGRMPPVIHVDTDAPLFADGGPGPGDGPPTGGDGELLSEGMWGIYYKPDIGFGGIQGGSMPYRIETDADGVRVDPYGPESPEFVVGRKFARFWCSALSFCQKRFEGKGHLFKSEEPSGGIGAFSPDSFPVFDTFHQNCYVIADSNHGFKMLGVGELVAGELLGERSKLLEPFRFSRFERGELHPVSHSPFPWS